MGSAESNFNKCSDSEGAAAAEGKLSKNDSPSGFALGHKPSPFFKTKCICKTVPKSSQTPKSEKVTKVKAVELHQEDKHPGKSITASTKRQRHGRKLKKSSESEDSSVIILATNSITLSDADTVRLQETMEQLVINVRHTAASTTKDQTEPATLRIDDIPKNVLYYGWFFTHEVSLSLKEIAMHYLNECFFKVRQFERFLNDACKGLEVRDHQSFYRRPRKKSGVELKYHITAKFLERESNPEYENFVLPFLGKKFQIHLVGMYFTQKTCGLRINLTEGQLFMFDTREKTTLSSNKSDNFRNNINTTSAISTKSDTNTITAKATETQALIQSELESQKNFVEYKSRKCKSSLHAKFSQQSGIQIVPRDIKDFEPTKTRAHITIGCAPKVNAVQTGIDLLDIINLESQVASSKSTTSQIFFQDYHIDGGVLRQFGRFGDAFVIYPSHELVADAHFDAFI